MSSSFSLKFSKSGFILRHLFSDEKIHWNLQNEDTFVKKIYKYLGD
jgi:hypothetical protein